MDPTQLLMLKLGNPEQTLLELSKDLLSLLLPEKTSADLLLFFKLYDPEKEELRYVGRSFVKALGKPTEILTKLNELAGFPPNKEIELFEFEDGDIICYQRVISKEDE